MSNDTVVDKLLEDFNSKIKEAREIYTTLKTLKKYEEFDLPHFGEIEDGKEKSHYTVNVKIRPDEFFGQTNNDAAEKYLRKIGHAMPLNDIYEALLQGGIKFTGDGHRNVYTQLIRANRKFVKIGSGQSATFGLIEWYPKKIRNEKNSIADKTSEDIVNSVNESNIEKVKTLRRRKVLDDTEPAKQAGNSTNEEENKL